MWASVCENPGALALSQYHPDFTPAITKRPVISDMTLATGA